MGRGEPRPLQGMNETPLKHYNFIVCTDYSLARVAPRSVASLRLLIPEHGYLILPSGCEAVL